MRKSIFYTTELKLKKSDSFTFLDKFVYKEALANRLLDSRQLKDLKTLPHLGDSIAALHCPSSMKTSCLLRAALYYCAFP
jgi:hypothetical protein